MKHLISLLPSYCLIGINTQPSQSLFFPLETDFKFKGLFKISVDVEEDAVTLQSENSHLITVILEVLEMGFSSFFRVEVF